MLTFSYVNRKKYNPKYEMCTNVYVMYWKNSLYVREKNDLLKWSKIRVHSTQVKWPPGSETIRRFSYFLSIHGERASEILNSTMVFAR
ncbi:hypothetical protein WN55_10835 [Dufourea novaeangliae]|uniref:Uncharacterized protein n=1 Tax=Dufourea novaeangliae TaxID=178035 RepID=A0A154P9L7_DUFNO|nr:hypothetical protein WN55_10835 [Dufourea novaeangliae]